MKTFGWICIVLGGMSFIGAASAGHSVFGPVFWLALGIALVYFGNQKEEEKKKNEAASTLKPKPASIIVNKPVQATEPIKQKTYWEDFTNSNPSKAREIKELLRIDMSKLSNRDAREKIQMLERFSKSLGCSIPQTKATYLKEMEQYPARLIPQMIETTKREMANEVNMFHILEGNTCSALMIEWLKERQQNAPKDESYWQVWKNENPEKAKALETLTDRDFDEMTTMDVKQTIKAFSSIAEKHNLEDWMDIKDYYVASYASFSENLGEEEAMRAISSILLEENNRVNVSMFNSVYNYAKQWIQEYKENNADRSLNPEDKFRKEYREKLLNKIGNNANIPLFCIGYDSPIAHELMYVMYQHLRNGELKAEAEKQGLWNTYMQIIVDETEKVTKKYCHVPLQECIEYYNFPDKPVVTRYRCPSYGSTNIMDDPDYGLECNECGRTWNAPYGKRLYL